MAEVKFDGDELPQFSIVDYVVFGTMLCISMLIGVYHSIKGNKTTEDFLHASHSLSPLPVALSLTATYLSAISILGFVGEVYGQGLQLVWSLLGNALGIITATLFIMPVMYPLKLQSVNEYVELRFHSVFLRKFLLVSICANYIMYLGFCLYAPTLALEAVTPLKLETYILILGVIVTLYCTFGGLKAVVWTDSFQTIVIIFGVMVATIFAIVNVGGVADVWNIAAENGRTEALDFSFGLYERHTVINTVLNGFMTFIFIYGFTQSTIQRAGAMPDLARVKLVLYLNTFGLTVLMGLLFVAGLAIFAVYAGCDPITLGVINQKDQLLPYFVMDYMGVIQGIPGLFVACLFGGTLSSISSLLSALTAMIWVDFISKLKFFQIASERVQTVATKAISLILGSAMIGLAFLASKMGGLVQAAASVFGALSGPILGVFVLGLMFPYCGKKGAISGIVSSTIVMVWLAIGAQFNGMKTVMLPLSIDECVFNNTDYGSTTAETTRTPDTTELMTTEDIDGNPLDFFYGISYTFYSTVGFLICIIVALIVTLITGCERLEDVDPSHVLLCLRRYVGTKESNSPEKKQSPSVASSAV